MLVFYYAPWTRAFGVRWLLEELGIDYEPRHVEFRAEGGVPEGYRTIQPNKKVPAIVHDGQVVTERAAITLYLADVFPQAGLAPAIGSPERAAYLTTTVYVDSVLDPCVAARAHDLTYASNDYSFGLFDDMVAYLERVFSERNYAAGDAFTAADTQLATAIDFGMNNIKVLPPRPEFTAYLARIEDRPAYQKTRRMDYEEAMKLPFLRKRVEAAG
jgi:glutathione S-transferase